ncbi:ABC transporter substrate-binding protein [Desmospora activa]|uniref:Carbohydrate ABC transporter substrate-binding protein (CUT1 family) n=1 Tax=Desmospora activa DSM 45169 TaxID=1121389 RepID=A0A2T4ZC06_9BACL|nr:sugar ABC transporter substrate-binding protein [Desmospora activa]PTM59417.1 carbohydrate ABC transporter substrate-binding protein (CUT1 family) [Desmospora activa DSM 45169]
MRKRAWSVLLSAVMVVALFAGCGVDDAAEGSQDGKVTIRFHTHGNEASYNWKETIAAFEKEYPDIKVNLVILSEKGDTQEAMKKLDLAAASGEEMDVLMFSDPASYAQRVGMGMVAPLDDLIAEDGYQVQEEYKVDTQLDGHVYALPGKFNPWYVLLNKDHLDEAGLAVPQDWTWDEMMDYAKKLTKGEGANKRYGVYFHGPQGGGWMEFLKLALGNQPDQTEFLKADGSSNLDSPLFRKSLEMRLKMEKEDQSSTPYEAMLSQKLHYRAQFFNQEASMIMIGSWMNTELGGTEQFPLRFDVAVAPYPQNEEDDPVGYAPVTTDYMAVAAKSNHPKEAYQFIRWYTTEGQLIQGKNIPSWNKVGTNELDQLVDDILATTENPEKVDKESLVKVQSEAKAAKMTPPVSYQAEIYKVLNEEYEKLIFDKQDLDTTIRQAQERVQTIIDSNKK